MRCPYCNHPETRVIDSRLNREANTVRRRRECEGCNQRFTTFERVEEQFPVVIKRDKRREPYLRDKIIRGIQIACQKRPVSIYQIEDLVNRIEENIRSSGKKEIESILIGELVMERLKVLDKVAYVRFASVYKNFEDIDEFKTEVDTLKDE